MSTTAQARLVDSGVIRRRHRGGNGEGFVAELGKAMGAVAGPAGCLPLLLAAQYYVACITDQRVIVSVPRERMAS